MKIGYIGLGKMGLNMVLQAQKKGHEIIAWNRGEEGRIKALKAGAKNVVETIKDLVQNLTAKKIIWIMVSHSGVDAGNRRRI